MNCVEAVLLFFILASSCIKFNRVKTDYPRAFPCSTLLSFRFSFFFFQAAYAEIYFYESSDDISVIPTSVVFGIFISPSQQPNFYCYRILVPLN